MKSLLSQARYRAPKLSACGLCKPQKRDWADKKTTRDLRLAVRDGQQLRDLKP